VSNNLYGAIDLVGGGTGARNKIDGADLVDKDGAIVRELRFVNDGRDDLLRVKVVLCQTSTVTS